MNVEDFIVDLLHIDDVENNRLLDIDGNQTARTYYLSSQEESSLLPYLVKVAQERYGKPGNTILRNSALGDEQRVGFNMQFFDWKCADGINNVKKLNKYIEKTYKDLKMKGNNPLFLGVGGLRWIISNRKGESKEIISPILIYPIRLIRSGNNTPVVIEFVSGEVFVNPCLIAKLESMWGRNIAKSFPHPNGIDAEPTDPVDLMALGDGVQYFEAVKAYAKSNASGDSSGETVFQFEELAAISQYNHNELCTYYDIHKHHDLINSNLMIDRIFNERSPAVRADITKLQPVPMILPRDSVQEEMIKRIVAGESMIIKGPPGTGKTQTIANIVAALLASDKKVLLASQKSAALSEVYKKLPEKLQKFVMLLDSETEEQAANLNPAVVLSGLQALIRERKNFQPNKRIEEKYKTIRDEINKSIDHLTTYVNETFTESQVAGVSYFEAIDRYCKKNLRVINFTTPLKAFSLTRENYASTLEQVSKIGKYFDFLTAEGKRSIKTSPWYPSDGVMYRDSEGALQSYNDIACDGKKLLSSVKTSDTADIAINDVSLACFAAFLEYDWSADEVKKLLENSKKSPKVFKKAEESLQEYLEEKDDKSFNAFTVSCDTFEDLERLTKSISIEGIDVDLKASEWNLLYQSRALLQHLTNEKELVKCVGLASKLKAQETLIDELENALREIFRSDLNDAEQNVLFKAYGALKKYEKQPVKHPKTFDYKAKKAWKALEGICCTPNTAFGTLVKGVIAYKQMVDAAEQVLAVREELKQFSARDMSDEELFAIELITTKEQKEEGIIAYLKTFIRNADVIKECVKNASRITGADYTLGELRAAYKAHLAYAKFRDKALYVLKEFACEEKSEESRLEYCLASAVAWIHLVQNAVNRDATLQSLLDLSSSLRNNAQKTASLTRTIGQKLANFGKQYFQNAYTVKNVNVTFGELRCFLAQATDRNALNAATQYLICTQNKENLLPLDNFFRGFENNPEWRSLGSFEEYFEHSVFALAIQNYATLLGERRNGRGATTDNALDRWWKKTNELDAVQVDHIESMCMSRLDLADPDYAFVKAERANLGSLRLMLKQHAVGLLKLKKCFLLSPYSVSVLFGRKEFFDFDVVIMDEASQLTPTGALPALFRSKQCVLVGDEYQMPPIKHFETVGDRVIIDKDGDRFELQSDLSILSLALQNKAFLSEQLTCHYRSETESLIAFSQKKYYPGMRTFPSSAPKKDGVGIVDVYVPKGYVSGGRNPAEAKAVCEYLEKHFDKYYDERTGVLSQSVGVVAFGSEQLQEILSTLSDGLKKKIKKAESTFQESMKEKLIFFKTIEKVQGQETQHLIVSMTYGKRNDGKIYQAFGELNNGTLGQCIFNVAVTRAQRSITVIHSIKAEEIDGEKLLYIKEYLDMAERFGDEKNQFVSQTPKDGFLRSVGNFLESCGVLPDRIIYNYGVTENSIRIPIAILSQDKERAIAGIWCEHPCKQKEYLDYNARYYNTLRRRGWKLCRVFAHDWIDNIAAEKERLHAFVESSEKQ